MSREQLAADALAAGQAAKHNLRWMDKHPERVNQNKRDGMEVYLNNMIRFSEIEMKNARRAGRASLRNNLKNLLKSIVAFETKASNTGKEKGDRHDIRSTS
ncbi:hypothetical protein ACFSTH_08130 [Paenibacillus yanchengensis]|uniref:Uncharacterized protein n=1 Tax=Paenibacillus yanchengensis TaxID=2035833 RepID=A0ABW4YL67_9BACL